MRRLKLFLFFVISANASLFGQSTQDVFSQNQITWYGLDFSLAKFVGSFSDISYSYDKTGWEIKGRYFSEWNNVVANERDKYNLKNFYKKETVKYDLTAVQSANSKVNPDSMMTWNTPPSLTDFQLQEEISKYDRTNKQGIGLVYVVELFDKTQKLAIIHVTFFDMATGKILLTKQIEAEPGGFGLRNYWARTAYETMVQCEDKWKKWAKEAGAKL